MAEDEQGQAPARPGSRGPRVVTGDMKRAAQASRVVTGAGVAPPPPPADDAPVDDTTGDETTADETTADETTVLAETLVAPASTPAAPRRPRVVTRRTAAPPSAAAPSGGTPSGGSPSGDPQATVRPSSVGPAEPEPEPWRPTEVTRSIPPPVHRASAPPPPVEASKPGPPPKAPKPGKAPKPSKPPKASSAAGSGSGAGAALVLALVSLVSAGILAIPALVLAGRAKRRGAGKGLVNGARLVAVVSLVGWLAVAGIVVANVARPDGVDYAKLEAGNCIDTPEGAEVRRLTVRPCDEPHDAEVFAVVIHPAAPGDAFPGAPALLEYAATVCLGQPFTDYVGTPRGQSQLTEFEIVPESEAWHEGRRGLVCAVDNADRSPLTASIKASAK